MNSADWIFTPPLPEAEVLGRELDLPLSLARVLAGRGILDPGQGETFLRGTAADLHDPFLLSGMRRAVDRIRGAISAGQNILIFGDYDVDGVLSVVMLLRALRGLGAKVDHYIPDRLTEGYGLKESHLEVVLDRGASLVISVDCGIKSVDFVRRAAAARVDVIITDHHLPGPDLPPAVAILNPILPEETYPYRFLAGVGVVFKLIQALLGENSRSAGLGHYLKLVAIGTISDVAELRGENRLMVKEGLGQLKSVSNPGLKSLLEVCGLAGRRPSEGDVGFRVGPRLNAAGRLASAELAVRLFQACSPAEAGDIAHRLDDLNSQRQQTEDRVLRQCLDRVVSGALDREHKILVLGSEEWHRGIVGIVASRLKDIYHRPVILFSYTNGLASGSGRSIPEFSLIDCLDACRDFFLNYGGHRLAAGCTLPLDRMDDFKSAVNRLAEAGLTAGDLKRKIKLEADLDLGELDARFLRSYGLLAPFGVGNPTPLFRTSGAEVIGAPQRLKEKHVKFLVRQSGRAVEGIGWDKGGWADVVRRGDRLDLAFSLQMSKFGGVERLSLSLQDLRRSV